MLARIFKHGPGERRNNEEFISPIATNEMSRYEISEARNCIISLLNAMRDKRMDIIKDDLSVVVKKARSKILDSSMISVSGNGVLIDSDGKRLQRAVTEYFEKVKRVRFGIY